MNAASKAFAFGLLISAAAHGHPVYAQAGPDLSGAAPLVEPPISATKEEKHNTGWAFYLDNDALTTGRRDEDYTGGFTFTFSGARATKYPISLQRVLHSTDKFFRFTKAYQGKDYFQRHSFEFGLTLFTPADISTPDPIFDDHPYASLFFIANTQQTIVPELDVAYRSVFTLGILGLPLAGDIQKGLHDLIGSEEPMGWDNQISEGGEPTAKYTVSRQQTHSRRYRPSGFGHEFKTSIEGNIGFSTDATFGLSLRWGRINTPWWSFNPHQTDYINLGSPVVGTSVAGRRRELFLWVGGTLKYRLYNAILQGQFRDSVVTFDRSELESVIGEAWIGVTAEFKGQYRFSLFLRARTEEIKGPNARRPVWAGIILAKAR